MEKFNKWKLDGMPVKNVRPDNAGENKALKARSENSDWKWTLIGNLQQGMLESEFEYVEGWLELVFIWQLGAFRNS